MGSTGTRSPRHLGLTTRRWLRRDACSATARPTPADDGHRTSRVRGGQCPRQPYRSYVNLGAQLIIALRDCHRPGGARHAGRLYPRRRRAWTRSSPG
jgi:hypothetical protein